jgi:imidazolonepropionase-like amidohydrolase
MIGVNVVDVENGKILDNMTLKIKNGEIFSVKKAKGVDMQEDGWVSVDASGLFVCPGLIDCE